MGKQFVKLKRNLNITIHTPLRKRHRYLDTGVYNYTINKPIIMKLPIGLIKLVLQWLYFFFKEWYTDN